MNEKNLLVAVLAVLEREGTVSIPQLARMLDVPEDEVWTALDTLVFCYDSVSVRLDLHDSFASLERGETSRLLRLNEEETALLLDALEAQGFSPDDELCTKLLRAKGFLSGGDRGDDAQSQPSVSMVNEGNVGEVMELVARACDDPAHHLLAIEYQNEGASRAERRLVEPRALVSEGDHRYLWAYCREAEGWRSFRTDRIKRAELLEERYEPREDVPKPATVPGRGDITAHLRFTAGTPLPAWPGLVAGKPREDGSRDARIPWLGGMWLPKRIVAMFGAAVPLDPPELVEATRSYTAELLKAAL